MWNRDRDFALRHRQVEISMHTRKSVLIFQCAAILGVTLLLGGCTNGARQDQPIRERLQGVSVTPPFEPTMWLCTQSLEASEVLAAYLDDEGWEARLREFVAGFGRHSPQDDVRLILSCPVLILPNTRGDVYGLLSYDGYDARDISRLRPALDRLIKTVCETQVESFLADPKILDRYYRFVLWSRTFALARSGGEMLGNLTDRAVKGLGEADTAEFWISARLFLLLAHATSRDDLLAGAKVADLPGRAAEWKKWLYEGERARDHLWAIVDEPYWRYVKEWVNDGPVLPLRLPRAPFSGYQPTDYDYLPSDAWWWYLSVSQAKCWEPGSRYRHVLERVLSTTGGNADGAK